MRRICLTTLCAMFLIAGVPAAMADTATSPAGTAGTATYTDDAGEGTNLSVSSFDANTIEFSVTGDTITEGGDCVEVDADTTRCPASSAVVEALDGNDTINASGLTAHAATLNGGSGDDSLTGGSLEDVVNGDAGEDFLTGGPGDDVVNGGNDPDTVSGGADNDEVNGDAGEDFLPGEDGDDSMDGGTGDDRFQYFIGDFGTDDIVGGTGIDSLSVVAFSIAPPAGAADADFSLNDQADDGFAADAHNVHSDVEDLLSLVTESQEHGALISTYYVGPPFLPLPEGDLTLRGSATNNTLFGGQSGDDLDGLAGNDSLVGGDGDDTLRSVDGYADRLKCGPGTDTALADTLDVVSDSCEVVTRTNVGNANDVPEVPEDVPPTVVFTAPAAGAVTTGVSSLVATASDDRGVAAVVFIDDDRIVCTDTVAPYTCDYQPRGEDVGRNTVTAVAVDTAQQTGSARRVFSVPRFAPAAVSLRIRPRRDATMPIRFTSTGLVTLPAQVTPALGCVGSFVAIQVKAGSKTISNRRVALNANCTYRSRVTFRSRRRFPTRRALRVTAVYAGNSVLTTARSARRSIRIR